MFFDTCVYHFPGIELMAKVIPVDNILFASEMLGAVKGIDPETGHNYDDTKRYVDQLTGLDEIGRYKIFEGNARTGLSAAGQAACGAGQTGEGAGGGMMTCSPRTLGTARAN